MTSFSRLLLIGSLASIAALAENWSGFLVDADCFSTERANMRAGTPPASMNNDRTVRVCTPKPDSKAFVLMTRNGTSHELDAMGNQKARDLVLQHPDMTRYSVNVSGDESQHTITVGKISLVK